MNESLQQWMKTDDRVSWKENHTQLQTLGMSLPTAEMRALNSIVEALFFSSLCVDTCVDTWFLTSGGRGEHKVIKGPCEVWGM